jgi:hypothetical protein
MTMTMNTVVTDIDELIAAVRRRNPKRVGIDGVDGAGKSHLSLTVASELNAPVIELDKYVEKHRGGYVAFIDYPTIKSKIAESPSFVIEGVCLVDVTTRLCVQLDCLIYVKRMSSRGLWADEDECEFPLGVEGAIRRLKRNTDLMLAFEARQTNKQYAPGAEDEPGLREEILRYHAMYRPHMIADITFCRDAE